MSTPIGKGCLVDIYSLIWNVTPQCLFEQFGDREIIVNFEGFTL